MPVTLGFGEDWEYYRRARAAGVRLFCDPRIHCRFYARDLFIEFLPHMPPGPLNRVASNRLARELLGWQPEMKFMDGLHRTIDWYFASKEREKVGGYLEEMLTER